MQSKVSRSIYERYGVRRAINCMGWVTILGGSTMPPEVVQAMNEAVDWTVDLSELNEAVLSDFSELNEALRCPFRPITSPQLRSNIAASRSLARES